MGGGGHIHHVSIIPYRTNKFLKNTDTLVLKQNKAFLCRQALKCLLAWSGLHSSQPTPNLPPTLEDSVLLINSLTRSGPFPQNVISKYIYIY